ncbi:MAG: sensor histidine kinase, partial [Caldithrix sp.]|nr:sensor histidine kinase [Caldithrix sp.]
MKQTLFNQKGNFKGFLFLIGIVLIISGIWYSQNLVEQLKDQTTEYIRFRIKVFEENINNPEFSDNVDFLFSEIIQTADYPIIYTDKNRNPQSWRNINARLDTTSYSELTAKDSLKLSNVLQQMASENEPIPIEYEGSPLGYYFYGYSPVIYKLRMFPYVAIISATLFILLGYLGFSYIKRSEQQFIWVGMAKETAHQLGTPLSSISGWLELLKNDSSVKDEAVHEMYNDLNRLNKITDRFSKIGSVPSLERRKVNQHIQNVVTYFNKRLPNQKNKVVISFTDNLEVSALLNAELFEWVLENLIKNALDATKDRNGIIDI